MSSIIFGPINSRRFGKSLGVDLSPSLKQCNFDCLYCELQSAKTVDTYNQIVPVNEIIIEIKKALEVNKDIDYLTITANGEPTLYPHLKELITQINSFKGKIKTLILTNSSTIDKKDIQDALNGFNSVKLSLDCISSKCFKKIDRASSNIDIEAIKKGILEFSKTYKGELLIEILFVDGINDKEEEVKLLNNFLMQINPTRVDIGTIDRPPAYSVKPISYDKLHKLSLYFDSKLPISIASKHKEINSKYSYSKEDILETLKRRPLTMQDINTLFDNKSKNLFNNLLKDGNIIVTKSGNIDFFKPKDS